MFVNQIVQALTYFLAMLFALTFHEAAHAYVAHIRGDNTAQREGRLSLNPAVHADLVGTIILPLAGFLMQLPIIGWAKPVPYDERYLKHPQWDAFLIAIAGPMSNFLMALVGTILVRTYNVYGTGVIPDDSFFFPLIKVLVAFVYVNAALGLFNLIPLPPLDGASFLKILLPRDMYDSYESVAGPYGFILLLMLAMGGGLQWIGAASRTIVAVCDVVARLVLPG